TCALPIFEGHGTGDGEGHFGRVDLVVRTIPQGDLDVHHGIAGQHARLHSTLDTVVDSRDVFLRDSAAHDGVDELVTLAGLIGLDLEDRKSTRLNSSHVSISYAVFCLKKTRHT